MAIHTDLPVYKLCYDLLTLTARLSSNMPRDFKSSFGVQLRNECVSMLVLIARANAARQKVPHITALLESLHVVELMVRLAHDLMHITHKQYATALDITERIGRQAGGWRRQAAASSVA
jgi:hypothetical protein